jgi:hypothetical protein
MRISGKPLIWGVLYAASAALAFFPSPSAIGDPVTAQAAPDADHGQLTVGSPLVTSLTLVGENGASQVFDRPGRQVSMPVGRYRIEQVELQGDYQASRFTADAEHWLEITADRARQLRVDGLVKPTVEITRQGRLLELDYLLADSSGSAFTSHDQISPPRFTVYKGDQRIASGAFEYG